MRTIGLIGVIIWLAFISYVSLDSRLKKSEIVCGLEERRFNYIFALIVLLPVVLWAGLRQGAGYVDTNAYIKFYEIVPTERSELINYLKNVYTQDPGFTIFTSIIKSVFGNGYTPFLFIIAAIQGGIIALFYRKFSIDYMMSIFLFIASAEYYSWMFNGMRQFLAVVITIAAFQLYLDKKYVKFVFVILLASTIHLTAIIMIPIALCINGKPWNKRTLIAIAFAVLALVATDKFTNILDSTMQYTQYSDSVSSWLTNGDNGTNPIRVLVHSVPTILAFIGRQRIKERNNAVINICVNMSIISTALWFISMVTSGIYMGRLPVYANLYNYILIPYEIKVLFDKKSSKLLYLVMISLYLFYYYYQISITWGLI